MTSAVSYWTRAHWPRRGLLLVLAFVAAATIAGFQTPAAQAKSGQASLIVRAAKSHLHARFQFGATGPHRFDCSGLVYRVFKETGLVRKIGGGRMGAIAYMNWFIRRGLASRGNPQKGDLIIWNRGQHMGIYIGHGMAISALIQPWGVTKHPVKHWIHAHFTTYLHTGLTGGADVGGGGGGTGDFGLGGIKKIQVISSSLNVRAGPSERKAVIDVVYEGTKLKVVGKDWDSLGAKWLKVKLPAGAGKGWLSAAHVVFIKR